MTISVASLSADISLVRLSGRLVTGEPHLQLRETVNALKENGQKFLILEMSEVTYIDRAGLQALIDTIEATRLVDGNTIIVNLLKEGKIPFLMPRVRQDLPLYGTVDEAVAALRQQGGFERLRERGPG